MSIVPWIPVLVMLSGALAEINPEQVRALDVATALNLQIINFDTASSTIPDVNKSILDQAAALMQKAPASQTDRDGAYRCNGRCGSQ